MDELTAGEFAAAKARGEARVKGPRAEGAHYDATRNRVIIRLTTGIEIGFDPRDAEGLEHASADELRIIQVEALGLGIHFPALDADIYVPALLDGILGSETWMSRSKAHAPS